MHSFINSYSVYNQVKMSRENKEKITSISEWGAYEYNIMQFGLCNAPTTFQKVVKLELK
jgi:hypothetical protein